jgi:hypothetical protein
MAEGPLQRTASGKRLPSIWPIPSIASARPVSDTSELGCCSPTARNSARGVNMRPYRSSIGRERLGPCFSLAGGEIVQRGTQVPPLYDRASSKARSPLKTGVSRCCRQSCPPSSGCLVPVAGAAALGDLLSRRSASGPRSALAAALRTQAAITLRVEPAARARRASAAEE